MLRDLSVCKFPSEFAWSSELFQSIRNKQPESHDHNMNCTVVSVYCNCSAGRAQPDNREQVQQGGEEEACMAVLNNFYGDGKLKVE